MGQESTTMHSHVAQHPIHRITAIGRPVEPKYPTNLAILIVMAVAMLAMAGATLMRGGTLANGALAGLTAALMAFITWALGRELAPDDNPVAFIAVGLVAVAVVLGVRPLVLVPAVTLGLTRVVNRTVGPPARLTDRLVLVVLVLVVAREGYGWSIGLAALLAFALDGTLAPRHRSGWPFAVLAAVVTGLGMILGSPALGWLAPGPITWAAVAITLAFVAVTAKLPTPVSEYDLRPGETLSRTRVQGGMLVGMVASLPALLGGDHAVLASVVLWANLLAIVIRWPWLR